MTKRNLILHIGTPKTGTTAIQSFCNLNNKILQSNNFYYFQSPLYHDNSHHLLSFLLWGKEHFDLPEMRKTTVNSMFQKMKKEMSLVPSIDNFILSSEILFDLPSDSNIRHLKAFIDENFDSVKIICYLRRQDYYIQSVYLEWMKSNYNEVRTKSIYEFSKHYDSDYYTMIKSWSEIFGKENMNLRVYEKGQLKDKSIFSDFLNVLGIELTPNYILPPKDQSNIGLNLDAYLILKACPDLDFEILEQIGIYPYKSDVFPLDLLSTADRIGIMKKYATINERLARDFFNRKNGKLFYDPISSNNDKKKNSLSLKSENIIPKLIAQLINKNTKILELKNKERALMKRYVSSKDSFDTKLNHYLLESDHTIRHLKNKNKALEITLKEMAEQKNMLSNLINHQQHMISQMKKNKKNILSEQK